jgi:mono/diheme cytochrome c family protein
MKNPLYSSIQTGLLLLLLLVGVAVSLPATVAQEKQDSGSLPEGSAFLPEGEGKAIILSGCVQCHNLTNTVSQRKTADRWRRTVNEMIWRGTLLTADEAETITKYLAVSFGPDKPMPAVDKKKSERR